LCPEKAGASEQETHILSKTLKAYGVKFSESQLIDSKQLIDAPTPHKFTLKELCLAVGKY